MLLASTATNAAGEYAFDSLTTPALRGNMLVDLAVPLGQAALGYAGNAINSNTSQANAYAQQQANYGTQLGEAQLGYLGQNNQQNLGLNQAQLNWMASTSIPYPNSSQYNNLAQQYGIAQLLAAQMQGQGQGAYNPVG